MIRLESAGNGKRSSAPKFMCIFAIGIAVGFAASSLMVSYKIVEQEVFINFKSISHNTSRTNEPVTCPPQEKQKQAPVKNLHYNIDLNSSFARELLQKSEEMHARRLADELRVLCWVMTTPDNHKEKAFHVKATWGRHCNKLIFVSDEEDSELPAVKLDDVAPGREGLWSKTVAAFKYVHEKYKGQYDWVMKADDDTYLFVENLRLMLMPYSSGDPIYFGFRFKPYMPMGYMSGGAGYVVSKEALDRLVIQFNEPNDICRSPQDPGAEDINIAMCLHSVGVKPGDSRDSLGRNRFLPFTPTDHLNPNQAPKDWWYWDYIWWPIEGGLECCSDEPVTFHYVDPLHMYMIEYLAYHVKPFGVTHLDKAIAPPHTTPSIPNTTQ